MKAKIIDGKARAAEIKEELKAEVARLARPPKMAVILVGTNPASQIYVKHKKKTAEEIGIETEVFALSEVMTEDTLVSFVRELNQRADIDGIIVQLPLPKHINATHVIESIDPEKDIDGLCSRNLGKLFTGLSGLIPCTPLACMDLIKTVRPNTDGLRAVIVGRSCLVGKPLGQLLLEAQCTVTQAHSHTRDLAEVCQTADILVVAAGRASLITAKHIKPGAIVIDVGINRDSNGKLCGDVDFAAVSAVAGAITPVPGGVGPMTVIMLMKNVVQVYLNRGGKKRLDKPESRDKIRHKR